MSLFDFLKKKKEAEKAKPSVKKTAKVVVPKDTVSSAPKVVKKESSAGLKKGGDVSYILVKEPHISEKANYLAERDTYVFKVYNRANKPEIKKTIEAIYGVDVISVNTSKIPPKKRRLGKTEGFKKGYAKAMVKIKKGQKIEIF